MFKHILVPLDGSQRAESAIAPASRIAHATGGTILLLRVRRSSNEFWPQRPPEPSETTEIERYLDALKHSADLRNIPTETIALVGYPADTILSVATERQADLIVVCRHGSTGLTRWVMGSVSQKVTRASTVPVLILREDSHGIPEPFPDQSHTLRILVALDGSPFAEKGLTPAAQLLAALSSPAPPGLLHLLQVTPFPTEQEERIYQHYDINIREYNRREAEKYLQTAKESVSKELTATPQIQITTSVIEDKDIAGTLIHAAEPESGHHTYDLIALTTHGRGGLQRWIVGSVAERVLEGTHLPLLIVRP